MKDKIIVQDTLFGTIINVGEDGGYFLQFDDADFVDALIKELK